MFEQMMDTYRKATESTLKAQQDMLRQWTKQWTPTAGGFPGIAMGAGWTDSAEAFRKKWAEGVADVLNKHRENLDAQYRSGIRNIEEAFRLGEAKDPEQLRKLTEELWRQSFECLRSVVEAQLRDFQAVAEKGFEAASKGMAATATGGNG